VALAYDPLGRLQTSTASGATTNFLYAGDALVAEYDNSGNILRRYVPGPGQDEPAVWYEGAGTSGRRWLHADELGSIVAWSDGTGNPQATYGYGPYGEQAGWSGSRYSYTGQLMIPEAHLYNYKARVYDPGLGRFLQPDPIGYASDINAYAYTASDPVSATDPSGLAGGVISYAGMLTLPNGQTFILYTKDIGTLDNSFPECCNNSPPPQELYSSYNLGGVSYQPALSQALPQQAPSQNEIEGLVVNAPQNKNDLSIKISNPGIGQSQPPANDNYSPRQIQSLIDKLKNLLYRNKYCTQAAHDCLSSGIPKGVCYEAEVYCNDLYLRSKYSDDNVVFSVRTPDGGRLIIRPGGTIEYTPGRP
jgi:RHS repeat-associated protein